MVVRESYSQLLQCPVLTQWRPSAATQHSVQIFSEGSEKSEWQILHSEIQKENQLVWVIPELSTHTAQQGCSYSGAATMENSKVNLLCGWRERGMGKPSPSPGSRRGLSQAQDKPLSLVPCTACLPWHRPGLNLALAYPPLCRCLQVPLRSVFTHFQSSELSTISLDLKFLPQQVVILRRYRV